jgi:hypothetical protein
MASLLNLPFPRDIRRLFVRRYLTDLDVIMVRLAHNRQRQLSQVERVLVRRGRVLGVAQVGAWGGACGKAALYGRLGVLTWLRKGGCPWTDGDNGCPWDIDTARAAAAGGHLGVLCWALGNGCPYDLSVCEFAERAGQTHIVRWFHQQE